MARYKTKRVRINITKNDILSGKPGCNKRCPIARAVLRKFKSVGVNDSTISIDRKRYDLLDSAIVFINQYDSSPDSDRKQMKPFSFILHIKEYI